jgi:hypothetical protein
MTTYTRRITITYHEEQRSETSEKTTTAILVEGPPLLHTSARTLAEFFNTKGDRDIVYIRDLLVPKGQEVTLRDFNQPFHGLQLLTFTTICDHGD